MRPRHSIIASVLVTLGLLATPAGQVQQAVPSADAALRAVKAKFAPDTRLAVFDVTAERRGETVVLKGEVGDAAAKASALAAVAAAGYADVVDQILVLPDPALGADAWGVVTVSVAHVRARPSQAAEQVTESPMGAPVRLLKRDGSWFYGQTERENYLGFFESAQVAAMSRDAFAVWTRAPKVMTTALIALVRERPAADAPPVSDLVAGSILKAVAAQGGWRAVELPDGRRGFVEQASVQDYDAWKESRRPTPANIERTALQFMGFPYLWGGTSPKGFDCSGFTKVVYMLNGMELPRDADQQAEVGADVPIEPDLSQLRKGDLLFFSPSATRRDRISHVGIYLGDGVFIHCSGLVKRNSLSAGSPIYSENLLKRLVRVRRLATSGAGA